LGVRALTPTSSGVVGQSSVAHWPQNATHWGVRMVAEETGISKNAVARDVTLFDR